MMVKAEQDKFKAWKDEMPGSPPKLIVTGEVVCPTTGWKVGLLEASPQGINPAILILQIDATKPTAPAGQIITHLPVQFEKTDADSYQQVTIRGGGPDFTIAVSIVK